MNPARLKRIKKRLDQRVRLWYRRTHADTGVALSLDMEGESRTLLVTFGGMKSLAGLPSFEFVNLTRDVHVKRMFVRDPRQSWYHRGMPQHGKTLASIADSLRTVLADHDFDRLVTVGNSAGGYGALVFGTLLGADTVLAFGPQTVLDRETLNEMADHRWDYLLRPLWEKGALEQQWIDLRDALPQARVADTSYKIYFDEKSPDRLHAERLRDLEGVRLYRFGSGGHNVVRSLRDNGALIRIVRAAVGEPQSEQSSDDTAPRDDTDDPGSTLDFRTYQ
jgi:hypothetical protein